MSLAERTSEPLNVLKVRGVRKAYGALRAVDGVTFEVRSGETFGLVGPNGAGKSTLMKMISGLLEPDEGSLEVGRWGSPGRAEARRQVGIAPQDLAIYPELSARENVRLFGSLYGLSGRALRAGVDDALERTGLVEIANRRCGTYSGGQQRRLNIACALVHGPSLLILDEPTVGVDPQSRNHIFDSIERLRDDGVSILYSTHYMEEASRLCDRVAVVDRGRFVALSSVQELIREHGGLPRIEAQLHPAPAAWEGPGTVHGGTLSIDTAEPVKTLQHLLASGTPLRSFQVVQPNLETVFLTLTGRSLRDDGTPTAS